MRKTNAWTNRVICATLLACLAACTNDEKIPTVDEILAVEKGRIHAFLDGKSYSCFPYEGTDYYGHPLRDTLYVMNNDTTGTRPADKQFVLVDYDEMALNGSYIASTDPARFVGEGIATPYPVGGPLYYPMHLSGATPAPLSVALREMSEGTTGDMLLPSTLAGRPAGDYFYARFKIWRVIPDLLEYEKSLIRAYVDTLKLTQGVTDADIFTKKSTTGDSIVHLFITHCKEETGDSVVTSSRVKIAHALYLLNEAELASPPDCLKRKVGERLENNPGSFPTSGLMALFPGMSYLKKGDEATLIIPHNYAYKDSGTFDSITEEIRIPPYSTLVYRLKIVDVVK
ncbi:MAG: FKBP-type peptidyl-prolyl cis-trans isomerase [Odoribacteraceae bacterium]|jgi:hypothetical protein|nr:FKBP-type peptidyl-prolyl cis-trans isomerase [Odoribacteraceae bacterium]